MTHFRQSTGSQLPAYQYAYGDKTASGVCMQSASDYSPFGVLLDGRSMQKMGYRYSFQGQEHDDEVKGDGNSVNYKYRMHDPRVGRFFAMDPLSHKFPWNSLYSFSENRVLDCVELEGAESMNIHISEYINQNGEVFRLVSWDFETNKLGLGNNGIAEYLHRIDGTTEIRYTPDVLVNSGTLNKPNDHSTSERKWWQVGGDGPLGALFGKKVANWLRGIDNTLEGNHDPANNGGWGGSKDLDLTVGGSVISILAAPITASGSTLGWFITSVGIANEFDNVFTDINDKSGLMRLAPKYENEIKAGKFVGYIITSIDGSFNIIKKERIIANTIATFSDLESALNYLMEYNKNLKTSSGDSKLNSNRGN